ncbi:MAG: phospholipid carrier-dependent glycosyltransferase [Myxococcales bacterium]|nr:phospholipid carrier-dependent glycosyltransferase [Myxococcales bacterium]
MNDAASALPISPKRISAISLVLGLLAGVALWQRLRLNFNGAYLDESDYLYVGRLLHDGKPWNTYTYVFSSHIPLHILGFGERLGGLLGARALAAVLGAASLVFFCGATRTLLGSSRVALWALLLLSLQAPHIFISKFATYDVVSFFFFTASLWLLVVGLERRRLSWLWCILASVVFATAILCKYVVLVHAPILAIIVAVRRPKLLAAALVPCGLLLADYLHRHWPDLKQLYLNQIVGAHGKNSTRMQIATIALSYCGPVLLVALTGLSLQLRRVGLAWRAVRTHVFLLALGAPLIAYHVRSADMVSMYKHMVYPLLALVPLAAWTLHRLARRHLPLSLAVVAVLAALNLYQTRRMETAFPDLRPALEYLRPHVMPNTTILSEEGYVFRYAFPELPGRNLFEFTWFDNDGNGEHTQQDVLDAIWDGKPDYVLTHGQITPNLTAKLRSAILPHNYRKVVERRYSLSPVMSRNTEGTVELWKRNGTYKGQYPLLGN